MIIGGAQRQKTKERLTGDVEVGARVDCAVSVEHGRVVRAIVEAVVVGHDVF